MDAQAEPAEGDSGQNTASQCSVDRAPGTPGRAYAPFGLAVAAGLAARRWRRHGRKAGAVGGLLAVLALGTAGTIEFAAREARASVSVTAVFDDLVRQSNAIAAVTPVERLVIWEGGRIVTYTRVRVDTAVAGALPQDVWVRSLGGNIGRIGQSVEGEPSFADGQSSLVFLRARDTGFEVTARAQGQFAITASEGKEPRLASARNVGALLAPAEAGTVRFARDVLEGRALKDASREIAAAWTRLHAK